MKLHAGTMLFAFFLGENCLAQTGQKPVDTTISILGKWVHQSTEYKTTQRVSKNTTEEKIVRTLCNVCAEIDFKSDSTAAVRPHGSDAKPASAFLWSIKGNAVQIRNLNSGEASTSPFATGAYTMEAKNAGSSVLAAEVIMLTDRKGVRHILIKTGQ